MTLLDRFDKHYLGVDVGTGSVRVALQDSSGRIAAESIQPTQTWRDPYDARIYEQSTTDIWACIARAIRDVLASAQVAKEQVEGIGFDATCSLAVTNKGGRPVCITKNVLGADGERNIVLWADHRADEEADRIARSSAEQLRFFGGSMDIELQLPKILWLKNNMKPEDFARCQFHDLPDYLTYHATRSLARSSSSLAYLSFRPTPSNPNGWDAHFFESIGLGCFVEEDFASLGGVPGKNGIALTAGLPVGPGLTREAAEELGLLESTPVGSAVIDSYAGWLGTVAARAAPDGEEVGTEPVPLAESAHRLAVVAGTSSCHLVQSSDDHFVPGLWGPYKNAVFHGWSMNEGGQSATGQLIDFMLKTHPAYPELLARAGGQPGAVFGVLDSLLDEMRRSQGLESVNELVRHMHLYPDFHGNRSPLADARMRGSIAGLALDASLSDLAFKYQLTLEGIALQTRHILDTLNAHGHQISSIYMSGGQTKNRALVQLLADTCALPIAVPRTQASSAVVSGPAMLAHYAAEVAASLPPGIEALDNQAQVEQVKRERGERLWEVLVELTGPSELVNPRRTEGDARLLEAKYRICLESVEVQRRWRREVDEAVGVGK